MVQIVGPDGKPFYLPSSTEARRSWELARRSAQLQNNLAHVEQSIARSNAPFRPPGSTGQTIDDLGRTTTHYGPSGSKTVSPTGRTTYQPGTASPWRTPTNTVTGTGNPLQIRRPSQYAPTLTATKPITPPIRSRGVPKTPGRAIPKATGGRAIAGGAGGIASGVLTSGIIAAEGGTVGEVIGGGVGAGVGSVAGGIIGAGVGAIFGPPGAAAGGIAGSTVGGAIGADWGRDVGGWLDGPDSRPGADIPPEAAAGVPPPSIIPTDLGLELREKDLSPYGGVSFEVLDPDTGSIYKNSALYYEFVRYPQWEGTAYEWALFGTRCDGGPIGVYATPSTFRITATGVCYPATQPPPPAEAPSHPRRVNFGIGGPPPTPEESRPPGSGGKPGPGVPPWPGDPAFPGGNRNGRQGGAGSGAPGPGGNRRPPPVPVRPIPQGGKPGDVPSNTPSNGPSPPSSVPKISSGSSITTGVRFDNLPRPDPTTEADDLIWPTPQNPTYLDPAAQDQLEQAGDELVPDNGRYIPFRDKVEQWKENLPGIIPLPLGMPAGAPRAGDYPRPKGAPRAASRLRPSGTTATQTRGAEPPRQPPPPKTGNPCGCNVQIMQKLDSIAGAQAGVQGASLAAILEKLNTMQKFAEKAWETTRIQKILNVLTFVGVMHNVAMLSRDVGETFGYLIGNMLNVIGIEDENGSSIDVVGWFGSTVEGMLRSLLGDDLYEGLRETWNKASSVLRAASMVIWTMRSIMDSSLDLMEWIAENTGKIGNALKSFGVVGERSYPWMSERAEARNRFRARFDKVTGALENAEDVASSFSTATSNVLEIQQETGELAENFNNFRQTVVEGIPDPWADNTPVATAVAADKANSEAPEISAIDADKG